MNIYLKHNYEIYVILDNIKCNVVVSVIIINVVIFLFIFNYNRMPVFYS